MIEGEFRFPLQIRGKIEESAKKKLLKPFTLQSFSTTVEMNLGGGHQAATENGYGITEYDSENGENVGKDVKFYPASCVLPPEGQNSVDWIKGGMKGAKC